MREMNYNNGFIKRQNFSFLIISRNDGSKFFYNSKLSLSFKKDKDNQALSNNFNYNKTKNYKVFESNTNNINKLLNTNIFNSLRKTLITHKNFYNKYISSFKTYENSDFKKIAFLNHNHLKNQKISLFQNENFKEVNSQTSLKYSSLNKNYDNKNVTKTSNINSSYENKIKNFVFKNIDDKSKKIEEKAIEKRVIEHLEEKINQKTVSRDLNEINISTTNKIVVQREERALVNRVYESVIKKWEKENRRRGYLYE